MTATPVRVLMVEDMVEDAELNLLELRRGGYEPTSERVESAAGFQSALSVAAWDVILCDSSMPGFDARAALGLLKESGHDVPLIIVSGSIGEQRAVALMRAGASDFLMKGSMGRLAPAVEREVREAAGRRRRDQTIRLLSAIVISSDDAIVGLDFAGTVTAYNAGCERMYGYTAAEVVSRNYYQFLPPDSADELRAAVARVARGENAEPFETVRRHRDGHRIDVFTTVSAILDERGRVIGASSIAQEITKRKRAAEMQARDALILAGVRDAVITTDLVGVVTYWNAGAKRLFGWTAEEMVGRPYADRYPEPERSFIAEGIRKRVSGEDWTGEYESRRKDGSRVWIDARVSQITDLAGAVVGVLGLSHDITARKCAEVERDAALGRLHLQVERLPLAYLLTDADFRYTVWNPAAERTFGFAQADVLGKHPFEVIVPQQSRHSVADIFARLAAGEMDAHGTCENVTRDGRIIICDWYNTPLFNPDGTFQGLLSLAQDVTTRRRVEQELLLRDRAIQAVQGGIIISDATNPDHPIVYTSTGFERLTGYSAGEVVGRNCRFLQGPDTDPDAVKRVREALRDARPCDIELLNYRKGGTPFWNQLQISPVHDATGQLTHFISFQSDVSERRSLENQFRQAQKMDAVGRLAGGVAHDFNNLLTIINGYGEVVHDTLSLGDPSRALMDEITKAGNRAAGLTRQLLAFSRQTVLEPKVLDVNDLVRDLENMLRRLLGEDIDFATQLAAVVGLVKADPGQLEQAIVNLCVNSRDAMPRGGKLTVETRNADLDEAYAMANPDVRPGRYVQITVSDTGEGMTPETRARIFEPFFTTKVAGKGTGLGLSMVFGFVKQSHGHVAVYSEPGFGASFRIYLPRVQDVLTSGKSGIHRLPMPRGTETILLVEDEHAVRALGRHVLNMCGYTVLEAGHGKEAARVIAGHAKPIHLLVTDVVMPGGMSGRDVAEAMASCHPEARVLFTSGYTDDAVVRHGVLEAGTHFLQKPFSPTALTQKVRDVLDGTV